MRFNPRKVLGPAALTLVAALAGCSAGNQSPAVYTSEKGFGAGDRFGTYLFVDDPGAKRPINQNQRPPAGRTQPSTASAHEQNAD